MPVNFSIFSGDLVLVLNKYSLIDLARYITNVSPKIIKLVIKIDGSSFYFILTQIHLRLYSYLYTQCITLCVHLRHLDSSNKLIFLLYRTYLSYRSRKKEKKEKEKKTTKRKEREKRQRNLGRSGEFFSSRRSFICLVPKKSNQGDLWGFYRYFTFPTLLLF